MSIDNKVTATYFGEICGIDSTWSSFAPSILIKNVFDNGGKLRIYAADKKVFEDFFKKLLTAKEGDYDDTYSKQIDQNVIVKLNGISFEDFVESFTKAHMRRISTAIFSLDKNYEQEADFIVNSYKIMSSNMVVNEKPLEAKNCINMTSFSGTRTHKTLYALVNNRENSKLHLLCRLTKQDRTHIQDFEVYNGFKVIKPWFWLQPLFNNYNKFRMDYSWDINRGIDEKGEYIEFISPLFSEKKTVR